MLKKTDWFHSYKVQMKKKKRLEITNEKLYNVKIERKNINRAGL